MNTVWFAHGRESGPVGLKILALAPVAESLGWNVISPDYRETLDPDVRVTMFLDRFEPTEGKTVLLGSSMGAYVSLVASDQIGPDGLFLLAPAIGLPGYAHQNPTFRAGRTEVVQGWRDDIVPPANVTGFAERHRLPLHMLDDDHMLHGSMPVIGRLFGAFLECVAA